MRLRSALLAAATVILCTSSVFADDDETTTVASGPKPDCALTGDGFYVLGCSTKFWRCVNDILYNYDCPPGLYFNPNRRQCSYMNEIELCHKKQSDTTEPKHILKAAADFNCTGIKNGLFRPNDIVCSSTYIICDGGMAVEQACPWKQFFNAENQLCDFKENVPECIVTGESTHSDAKIGGYDIEECMALKTVDTGFPCEINEVCKAVPDSVNGKYLCDAPFVLRVGPFSSKDATQWEWASKGLKCGVDGMWYNNDNDKPIRSDAAYCVAKKSEVSESKACPSLKTICNKDDSYLCQETAQPVNGKYQCTTPFAVWYGDGQKWLQASAQGLRCSYDGKWMNGESWIGEWANSIVCRTERKKDEENACAGLFTSKDLPCDSNEVCQAIARPRNGAYLCDAPFSVWYGPMGQTSGWKNAPNGLTCGPGGVWLDGQTRLSSVAVHCSAPKTAFATGNAASPSSSSSSCPDLYTGTANIPCDETKETCAPITKPIHDKYACAVPYKLRYGKKGGIRSEWIEAQEALICKNGAWWDGEKRVDTDAVDCAAKKIDCTKLTDGAYNAVGGSCTDHFWQCANSMAYLYPCPTGLFFDEYTKACDFKELIEACGGKRVEQATTTTGAPGIAVHLDTTLNGCPRLVSDRAAMACPTGKTCALVDNAANGRYMCELPYVLTWGHKGLTNMEWSKWSTAENGLVCRNNKWFAGETEVTGDDIVVQCTVDQYSCVGKTDGSYLAHEEACSSYFWNCAHDESFLYRCPNGLFYDLEEKKCDYKEFIVACGGRKKDASTTTTPKPGQAPSTFDCTGKADGYLEEGHCQRRFWHCAASKAFSMDCPEGLVYDARVQLCQYPKACESELPKKTTPAPPDTLDHGHVKDKPRLPSTSFDCTGKSDGLYSEKRCHTQYVQCTNGRSFALVCPASLVFTEETGSCDYLNMCLNPTTSTTTTTQASNSVQDRVQPTPPNFIMPSCANLEDGSHALRRCGTDYFSCWQGVTTLGKCNQDLVFNPKNMQCDFRNNVEECAGAAVPRDVPSAAATTVGPPSPPPTTQTLPVERFCDRQVDGFYSASGCQPFFYSCRGTITFKMFCPVGLFYDEKSKACDHREFIVACGGAVRPSSTTMSPSLPQSPVEKTPVVDNYCSGKQDGYYAVGCQMHFYLCQAGTTYKMSCAGGLYYDEQTKQCDHKNFIIACGGKKEEVLSKPTTISPPSPAQAPITISDDFCRSKSDGYYSLGCKEHFFSCQGGVTFKITCPTGLFYNEDIKSCDYRGSIVSCGGKRPEPTTTPATALSPPRLSVVDTFCNGKVDGFYANACSDYFYSCLGGATYKTTCPAGLFYDEAIKQCDHRELIVACGGKREEATTSTTPRPTPAASVPGVTSAFCSGKSDGYYAQGCTTEFFYCQSANTLKMVCPAGLYYDIDSKMCDRREVILACGGKKEAPTTTTLAPSIPRDPRPTIQPNTFCQGKTDGFYGETCNPFFYSCRAGVTYQVPCPAGLYYDMKTLACDHRAYVEACGGKRPVPTTLPPTAPTASPLVPRDAATDYSCAGKSDAYYGQGCNSFFFSCQAGVTYKMFCPSGLFYDDSKKMCDHRTAIVACGGVAATTTTTTYTPPTVITRSPQVPPQDPSALFSCSGKQDGFYGQGCQQFYFTCQTGATYQMKCPAGLFYDVDGKACDRREAIVACGGKKEEPTTTTLRPIPPPMPIRDTPEYNCKTQADGFYSTGCNGFYFSCQAGITYKMMCPSGLFYDEMSKACDRREVVVACGGKKEVTTTLPPPTRPVPPTLDVVEFVCQGKPDDYYGEGCKEYYFSCQAGLSYKMSCPSGLFYDITAKACDHKDSILACGGKKTLSTTTSAPLPPAPPMPIRDTPEFSCAQKRDDFYAVGCQNYYFSCQAAKSYKMSCPSGLFYDDSIKQCDHRELIVACGGKREPTTTPLPTVPPMPERDIAEYSCTGKADDYYGDGCKEYYFSCQAGRTFKMACPSGLYYDAETKACDRHESVVACGGNKATTPKPVPLTTAVPPLAPIRDVVEFSCAGKTDGLYSTGCSEFFFTCTNGASFKTSCPSGLFYDADLKMCDRKELVVACGGVRATTTLSPPTPHPKPIRDVVEYSCAGKTDDYYGEGCKEFYFSCQAGMSYKMACPSGLFYDAEAKACDHRETIIACGGRKTEAPAVTTTPRPAPVPKPTLDVVEYSCAGKLDDYYGEGCKEYYFSCQAGLTYKMSCPSGLFYDITAKACDHRDSIVACGGQKTTPAPTTTPVPPMPIRDTPEYSCAGRRDDFYSVGCQNFYFSCQAGTSYKMACPSGLFYDDSIKQCDHRELIVACGGKRVPTTTPLPTVPPMPERDIAEYSCTGKPDDYYGDGCKEYYFSCQAARTFKMACPSGLYYDTETKACDRHESVVACGGNKATTPKPVPLTTAVPPLAPIRDVVEFSCAGKTDGLYSTGCSEFFFTCTNGASFKTSCPSGLFYDAELKMCDRKELVVACGGVRVTTTLSPPTPHPKPIRDVVEYSCAGKTDDYYGEGCKEYYFSCQAEMSYKMSCPSGLFYDAEVKACDHREVIVACGGRKTLAPSTTERPTPVPRPIMDVVEYSCTGKLDDYYGEGCKEYYFSCQAGLTYKMSCPSGLFYDITAKACDHRDSIVACGGQKTTPAPIIRTTAVPMPIRDTPEYSCAGKSDDFYSVGCQNYFFSCQAGRSYKMSCPSGLFYDGQTKMCDTREQIVACGGQRIATTTTPVPTTTVHMPHRDVVGYSCAGKSDDYYGEGCQQFYYSCQAGLAYKMACPSGLFYDISAKACDHKDFIVACGGRRQEVVQQNPPSTPRPITLPTFPLPSDPFCNAKVDGIYGSGCQTSFYSCNAAITHKVECPSGLFYDVESKHCDRQENIFACGGKKTGAASTPSSIIHRPVLAPSPSPYLDSFCSGKADGFYPMGCNTLFYSCHKSVTLKLECPGGLHYDPERNVCDHRDVIPVCGGRRPIQQQIPVVQSPPVVTPPPPSTTAEISCSGRQSGFFHTQGGCHDFFYSCVNGQAYKMMCPSGLFYDDALKACDYREFIVACGGIRTATTPSPTPPSFTVAPDVPRPVNADCLGKKNGIHSVAVCSPQFLACQDGVGKLQSCQKGLIYNQENMMCDYQENVRGCGAVARDTLPARGGYDVKKKQEKRPSLSFTSGTSCASLPDGYYSQGCSSDYIACISSQSTKFSCPSHLMYSAATQMCDFPDNVNECSGRSPPKTQKTTPKPVTAVEINAEYERKQVNDQPRVSPRCVGKSDGIYPLSACTQNYLACVKGRATIGLCRDDLWYNAANGLCDWKESIPACQPLTTPLPSTTTIATTFQPIVPLITQAPTTVAPLVQAPPASVCSGRADGLYSAQQCSPFYIRCKSGRLFSRGTCPSGQFYNPSSFNCASPSNVMGCSLPSLPASDPQFSYSPSVPAQAPVPVAGIIADPRQFCYGRPDGIYGNSCNKSYMICTKSATFPFTCPGDFIFNRERSVCDHPSRIPFCNAPIAPQAAPSAFNYRGF